MQFSFSEIAGTMPLMPATTFLQRERGGGGNKDSEKERKELFSPLHSQFL